MGVGGIRGRLGWYMVLLLILAVGVSLGASWVFVRAPSTGIRTLLVLGLLIVVSGAANRLPVGRLMGMSHDGGQGASETTARLVTAPLHEVAGFRSGFAEPTPAGIFAETRAPLTRDELVASAPSGLARAWLDPPPWSTRDGRTTGGFRRAAGAETVLIAGVLPFAVIGAWRMLRRSRFGVVFVAFVVLTSTAMGLVILNTGTLFRLRLLFLVPALVLVGVGWGRRRG